MTNMVLYKPIAPAVVAASTGTGAANLVTYDPKEAWATAAAGTASNLDFDFGANVSVDSLFIGFIAGGAAPIITWSSGTASYTTTVNKNAVSAYAGSDVAVPLRRHGFWRLGAAVNHRYHRVAFDPGAAATATIGIVAFGLAFQPTYNREWGGGRQPIDTGAKQRLLGGGFGIGEGARKAGFGWVFGDLTDADIAAFYDLAMDRGETRPLILVEDPDPAVTGLNERIHYGLFDRFDRYARQNPNLTRWELSMEQWV